MTRNLAGIDEGRKRGWGPVSPRRVQPFRDIFPDQHLLFARMFWQVLGFENHLDPLKMGRKALAWPCRPRLARGAAFANLRPQGGNPGLDLLEDEGLLRILVSASPSADEPLGATPEPGAIIGLQDLHQPLDPRVGIEAARLQRRILILQHRRLLCHGANHGLEQVHVIGQGKIIGAHAVKDSTSRWGMPRLIDLPGRGDSLCRGPISQQIQAPSPLRDAPVSSPDRREVPATGRG